MCYVENTPVHIFFWKYTCSFFMYIIYECTYICMYVHIYIGTYILSEGLEYPSEIFWDIFWYKKFCGKKTGIRTPQGSQKYHLLHTYINMQERQVLLFYYSSLIHQLIYMYVLSYRSPHSVILILFNNMKAFLKLSVNTSTQEQQALLFYYPQFILTGVFIYTTRPRLAQTNIQTSRQPTKELVPPSLPTSSAVAGNVVQLSVTRAASQPQ